MATLYQIVVRWHVEAYILSIIFKLGDQAADLLGSPVALSWMRITRLLQRSDLGRLKSSVHSMIWVKGILGTPNKFERSFFVIWWGRAYLAAVNGRCSILLTVSPPSR